MNTPYYNNNNNNKACEVYICFKYIIIVYCISNVCGDTRRKKIFYTASCTKKNLKNTHTPLIKIIVFYKMPFSQYYLNY